MAKTFFALFRQFVVPAGTPETELPARAARKLGLAPQDILSCQPVRRSLDARRRRGNAVWVYHLRLEFPNALRSRLRELGDANLVFETRSKHLELDLSDPVMPAGGSRPVVVGAGPAGMFAALRLARAGWKPLLFERGDSVLERRARTGAFWRDGILDPESNPLYGAGGAGLFSDGKLTTRHKDRDGLARILAAFIEFGAPESIALEANPHVGTDLLGDVVDKLLAEVERFGGEVWYRARLDEIVCRDRQLTALRVVRNGEALEIATERGILATGHSARDVYAMLRRVGVELAVKPFAVGVRVEMPQEAIDRSQYGDRVRTGQAASFQLSCAPGADAGACYTFCMCPGGEVIACASEPEHLVVNGMSRHARAGEWGNAAFLTPVAEEDFRPFATGEADPLAGIAFQRHWESAAYRAGLSGGPYAVPACRLEDFVAGRAGELPARRGWQRAVRADLASLLPTRVVDTLKKNVPAMLARLRHVDLASVLLYGIETRTSSPVRIVRGTDGMASVVGGLFPAGEGSGYAGGIMTSALDGWKAAGQLMR